MSPLGVDARRPRFSWIMAPSRSRNLRQSACRVLVATSPQRLKRGQGDVWDSGREETQEMRLSPVSDLPLLSQTRYWWSVAVWDAQGRSSEWSAPQSLVTGMMSPEDWRAEWIAADPDPPAEKLPPTALTQRPPVEPKPLPIFQHGFMLADKVRSAVVSVCGLGQYELTVNGRAATTGVLNPAWTNYRKTVLYNTFDVTGLLRRGRNTLDLMLGNGMYNEENYPGRYTKFTGSFGQAKLILQLRVVLADGSEITVASDASWRTRPGPVTLSSAYNEDFDARRTLAGEGWSPVRVVEGPGGKLRAQTIPPVVEARAFKPVAITEPKPGVFVYDLGQNFSGWPKIAVRGPAGSAVKLTPGELLADDGQVSQRSVIGRPGVATTFNYTLRGGGLEHWHPRFSYFGFRYIQVEGAAPAKSARRGLPVLLSLEGAFLHTDLRPAGDFRSSDSLFDRIHRLIKYALLSNTFSVLTDCPTREKLGWLEQTYLNADTVFCNEDALTLYEKSIRDIVDSQTADGMVPGIAPEYVAFIKADGSNEIWRDSPEWGAAVALSPLAAYRYYGDLRVLETGYPAMQRYADYLESRANDGLIGFGMGDWYDIGPKPPGPAQQTSLTLTSSATYYAMLCAMATIAARLGKADDADRYRRRADELNRVFNEKLFNPATGGYDSNSQTANAMPLALGMVPAERGDTVLNNLVKDIRAHSNHVTAGDIGFHYVLEALMAKGRADVLFDVLSRTDQPSYGYQLARGATALMEAWDANPHSSQNHFMLGHAETWFYRGLAGINVDMTAEKDERIRIAPQTMAGVAGASATYRSVLGDITCTWRRNHGVLQVFVAIPPGAEARIVLPAASADAVRESSKALSAAIGVLGVECRAGRTSVTAGSGDYSFSTPDAHTDSMRST